MIVYACRNFDIAGFRKAQQLKATHVITNVCSLDRSMLDGKIELLDARVDRVAGSWLSYDQIGKAIESLKKQFPEIFSYRGVDFSLAYNKALYWGDARENCFGNLEATVEKLLTEAPEAEIHFETRYSSSESIKAYFSILKNWLWSRNKTNKKRITGAKGTPYIFFSRSETSANASLRISSHLDPNEVSFLIMEKKTRLSSEFLNKGYSVYYPDLSEPRALPVKLSRILTLRSDWVLFSQICHYWSSFTNFIDFFTLLAEQQSRVVISNAEENTPWGHLLWELQKRVPIKTVNRMNGVKAPMANNAGARFNRWIVWDSTMKSLLSDGCRIDEEQFCVLPHLRTDEIRAHVFSDSLPLAFDQLQQKKVVSYIDVFDMREDKVTLLDTLYGFLSEHPDYLLLYRPKIHIGGKFYPYLPQDDALKNQVIYVDYSPDTKHDTLYDQIVISDLVICIGSTVALEAKIGGTPVITFEKTENSLLYFVDGESVKHIRTASSLLDELQTLRKKAPFEGSENSHSIGENYALVVKEMASQLADKATV